MWSWRNQQETKEEWSKVAIFSGNTAISSIVWDKWMRSIYGSSRQSLVATSNLKIYFILLAVANDNYCISYIKMWSYWSNSDTNIFAQSSLDRCCVTTDLTCPRAVHYHDKAYAKGEHLLKPLTQTLTEFGEAGLQWAPHQGTNCGVSFWHFSKNVHWLHIPINLNPRNAITAVKDLAPCTLLGSILKTHKATAWKGLI